MELVKDHDISIHLSFGFPQYQQPNDVIIRVIIGTKEVLVLTSLDKHD